MVEVLTVVVTLIAVTLIAMAIYQTICSRSDARKFPPPGRIVTIAGNGGQENRLLVLEMGAGRPAVVLESGISTTSLNWSLLQPMLASFATTCSYDRAGLGWSDSDGGPRTIERIAEGLHSLVRAINLPTPYILVAHSFGGYIARFYASRYPEEIAGVVLVDPLTPEEWSLPTKAQRKTLRMASRYARLGRVLATVGVARICFGFLQRAPKESSGRVVSRFGAGVTQIARRIAGELGKLPTPVQRLVQMQWSCPKPFWSMSKYVRALPSCAAEVANCEIPENIPVTVISGNHQPPDRLSEHDVIAKHSSNGNHIIAEKSGHWIQFDEPELILNAVRHIGMLHEMVAVQNPQRRPLQAQSNVRQHQSGSHHS